MPKRKPGIMELREKIERLMAEQEARKEIINEAFRDVNTDEAAAKFDGISKRDIRLVLAMMLDDADVYIKRMRASKPARKKTAKPAVKPAVPMPDGVLDHGEFRANQDTGRLGIWDMRNECWYVESVEPGMVVEVEDGPDWTPVIIELEQNGTDLIDKGRLYYHVEDDGVPVQAPVRENEPVRSVRGHN